MVGQMYTITETPTFKKAADQLWSDEEHGAFTSWIAAHSDAGDVIPGSGGCRKVHWSLGRSGKRGGVRVVYFVKNSDGVIWLLLAYAKNVTSDIPAHILKQIKEAIDHD